MKKFILIVLTTAFIYSCKESNQNGFIVSGTITDAAGKQLVLNTFTSKETIHLDTIVLDDAGNFSFNHSAGAPELYGLQLEGQGAQILFMADSLDNITIKSNGTEYRNNYTVDGSLHSTLLKQLYERLDVEFEKVDLLNKQYIEKRNTADMDSLNEAIGIEFNKIIESHKTFSKKFIDDNLNSPAIIMALYQQFGPQAPVFSLSEDREYFEKVNQSLMELYPNSSLVSGLNSLLESNPPIPGIGKIAPDIALENPDGELIKLSSLRGNYVLLDFWAAWCKPCRQENPVVVQNYKKYKKDNFTIYQVSLDRTKEDWINAIKADGLSDWYHVSDLKYWESEAATLYNVRGIPANFLLDPEGKIIASNLRGPYLGQKLSEIFGH